MAIAGVPVLLRGDSVPGLDSGDSSNLSRGQASKSSSSSDVKISSLKAVTAADPVAMAASQSRDRLLRQQELQHQHAAAALMLGPLPPPPVPKEPAADRQWLVGGPLKPSRPMGNLPPGAGAPVALASVSSWGDSSDALSSSTALGDSLSASSSRDGTDGRDLGQALNSTPFSTLLGSFPSPTNREPPVQHLADPAAERAATAPSGATTPTAAPSLPRLAKPVPVVAQPQTPKKSTSARGPNQPASEPPSLPLPALPSARSGPSSPSAPPSSWSFASNPRYAAPPTATLVIGSHGGLSSTSLASNGSLPKKATQSPPAQKTEAEKIRDATRAASAAEEAKSRGAAEEAQASTAPPQKVRRGSMIFKGLARRLTGSQAETSTSFAKAVPASPNSTPTPPTTAKARRASSVSPIKTSVPLPPSSSSGRGRGAAGWFTSGRSGRDASPKEPAKPVSSAAESGKDGSRGFNVNSVRNVASVREDARMAGAVGDSSSSLSTRKQQQQAAAAARLAASRTGGSDGAPAQPLASEATVPHAQAQAPLPRQTQMSNATPSGSTSSLANVGQVRHAALNGSEGYVLTDRLTAAPSGVGSGPPRAVPRPVAPSALPAPSHQAQQPPSPSHIPVPPVAAATSTHPQALMPAGGGAVHRQAREEPIEGQTQVPPLSLEASKLAPAPATATAHPSPASEGPSQLGAYSASPQRSESPTPIERPSSRSSSTNHSSIKRPNSALSRFRPPVLPWMSDRSNGVPAPAPPASTDGHRMSPSAGLSRSSRRAASDGEAFGKAAAMTASGSTSSLRSSASLASGGSGGADGSPRKAPLPRITVGQAPQQPQPGSAPPPPMMSSTLKRLSLNKLVMPAPLAPSAGSGAPSPVNAAPCAVSPSVKGGRPAPMRRQSAATDYSAAVDAPRPPPSAYAEPRAAPPQAAPLGAHQRTASASAAAAKPQTPPEPMTEAKFTDMTAKHRAASVGSHVSRRSSLSGHPLSPSGHAIPLATPGTRAPASRQDSLLAFHASLAPAIANATALVGGAPGVRLAWPSPWGVDLAYFASLDPAGQHRVHSQAKEALRCAEEEYRRVLGIVVPPNGMERGRGSLLEAISEAGKRASRAGSVMSHAGGSVIGHGSLMGHGGGGFNGSSHGHGSHSRPGSSGIDYARHAPSPAPVGSAPAPPLQLQPGMTLPHPQAYPQVTSMPQPFIQQHLQQPFVQQSPQPQARV